MTKLCVNRLSKLIEITENKLKSKPSGKESRITSHQNAVLQLPYYIDIYCIGLLIKDS